VSGVGKHAIATACGISPDLNFSTIEFKTCFTFSFIFTPPDLRVRNKKSGWFILIEAQLRRFGFYWDLPFNRVS